MRLKPDALREKRILAGLSQTEFARRLGVTHAAISAYELGKRGAHPSRIKEMADALKCKTKDIVDLRG